MFMDTNNILHGAKQRFSHNSAKAYLKDKYLAKLILAEQGGLWNINLGFITNLKSINKETVILVDNYDNPVEVNVKNLLDKAEQTYDQVMTEWFTEWKDLEAKR